jgi:BCD family chlorophyll transporter-like MFS transporter
VYQLEIVLLFATLVAIGPLVRTMRREPPAADARFGLAEFPG